MSAPPRHLTTLEQQIAEARTAQLTARINWAHSANADTIAAEIAATHQLDVLLDRWQADAR